MNMWLLHHRSDAQANTKSSMMTNQIVRPCRPKPWSSPRAGPAAGVSNAAVHRQWSPVATNSSPIWCRVTGHRGDW
jgi:hypothetical protein